jgi:glycosyltransferase involved in cell wall biosynthesis
VAADLAVLAQDPRFGGGGVAQTDAFCSAAAALGRHPVILSRPHPGLGGPRFTWRRIEALRQLAAARELEAPARDARSLWVASSLAFHGAAAARSRRPYGCWVGTTIRSEWGGRAPGLAAWRRAAAAASLPALLALERRVLTEATALYATSPASRAAVAGASRRDERDIRLLPIPIDAERFAPAEDTSWREALSAPVIVFVGRPDDPRKNVQLLLDAFADVRSSAPDARLRLVGGALDVDPPPGVEVVGRTEDVPGELRKAGLFVLPSRQEGFCIAAAEALAAGLPVVSTPCGGPEHMLEASGGGRVVGGLAPGDLAAAIAELAADPEAAGSMRVKGRLYVEREHSPIRFAELVGSALRELDD